LLKNRKLIPTVSDLNDPIRSTFSSYWCGSQLYRLKTIAKRVCSVQASSVPAEDDALSYIVSILLILIIRSFILSYFNYFISFFRLFSACQLLFLNK